MNRITILEALFLVTDRQVDADWRTQFDALELTLIDEVVKYQNEITDSADAGLPYVRELLGICIYARNYADDRRNKWRLQKAYEEALGLGLGELVKDFARAMDVNL